MNKRAKAQFWMELWSDLICLLLANGISFVIFGVVFDKILSYPKLEWLSFTLILILSYLLTYICFHSNIDIHRRSMLNEFTSVLKNGVLTYTSFLAIMALTKNAIIESRYIIVSGFIITIILSSISRYYLKRWITGFFKHSRIASYAGVITTPQIAEKFLTGIKADWTLNFTGVALLSDFGSASIEHPFNFDSITAPRKNLGSVCDIPVISESKEEFMDWVRSAPVDEVFINLPYKNSTEVQAIVEELEDMGITVHINIPTLNSMLNESKFNNVNCKMVSGYPMASFAASVLDSRWMVAKRVVDVIGGLVGCILSLPIVLITAIPLLIESPGPLIFKQQRVGKNGRLFNIYKLRSMYADAEEHKAALVGQNKMDGLMFKVDNDPRITKVGRFIRKYSIDELPQFFNVLKGDMSLVGTRPPTVDEFEKYESRHKRRLSMRPGITGMWQVSGRSDIQSFEEIVKLDCEYIDKWTPALDIKILFKTVYVVLTHKGAE